MRNIFISYASKDRQFVKTLVNDLEGLENDVWFDQELIGGKPWWDSILEKIRSCDLFIFVLSPRSLDSYPCKLEYEYASQLQKTILPVMISNVDIKALPQALSSIQFVDYRFADKAAFMTLDKALKALPPALPLPEPLPLPPEIPLTTPAIPGATSENEASPKPQRPVWQKWLLDFASLLVGMIVVFAINYLIIETRIEVPPVNVIIVGVAYAIALFCVHRLYDYVEQKKPRLRVALAGITVWILFAAAMTIMTWNVGNFNPSGVMNFHNPIFPLTQILVVGTTVVAGALFTRNNLIRAVALFVAFVSLQPLQNLLAYLLLNERLTGQFAAITQQNIFSALLLTAACFSYQIAVLTIRIAKRLRSFIVQMVQTKSA